VQAACPARKVVLYWLQTGRPGPFRWETAMMQHSTDYNAVIGNLGMGDRFQLAQHGEVFTVAWADDSVDGSLVYVSTTKGGNVEILETNRRCHIVEHAPRCHCNRRYERCELGCIWPEAMWDLYAQA
jgi:hypothetical protein